MADKYLLPKLREGAESAEKSRAHQDDCWEQKEDAYQFLLNYMDLDYESTESVFEGDSSAMPHVFEQMLVFNHAFFEEKHPDHRRAVMEWRAILVMLALKLVKNIKLDVIRVDLSADSGNPFIRAALEFLPVDMPRLSDTTWDFLYVLMLGDSPVAIFSPITVVCPAKEFTSKIGTLNDWLEIGRINGSEELLLTFKGEENEYANIVEWLEGLKSNLYEGSETNSEAVRILEVIQRELQCMIAEYRAQIADGFETIIKKNVYGTMNNNKRKEYFFLNNCCDFRVDNPEMEFLKEMHMEDIFQEKILAFVYDNKPDSIYKPENIEKLHREINRVAKINGKEIICVQSENGEDLAMFVFLPFKGKFIKELLKRKLDAGKLIKEYQAVFYQLKGTVEISMTIKGFPYSFVKTYPVRTNCQYVYAENMPDFYLWPGQYMTGVEWKAYYCYYEQKKPYYSAQSEVKYYISSDGAQEYQFQKSGNPPFSILSSEEFPLFVGINFKGVSGYIPLSVCTTETVPNGKTARVYVDMGHTTTALAIMMQTRETDKSTKQLYAMDVPKSLRLIGSGAGEENAMAHFVNAEAGAIATGGFGKPENGALVHGWQYFKNLLNDFASYTTAPGKYVVTPFISGQLLFATDKFWGRGKTGLLNFINFEYVLLDAKKRRRVHIFIEMLLLYVAYVAVRNGGKYMKVIFAHGLEENSAELGELKGLWEDAVKNVCAKTGMTIDLSGGVECRHEAQALANIVRYHFCTYQQSIQKKESEEEKVYVGVDIGWKKSLVTVIGNVGEGEQKRTAWYEQLAYGGKNIGFLDSNIVFRTYYKLLGILLGEQPNRFSAKENEELLEEFAKLYLPGRYCDDYYYGIYDLIAMKIERDNFRVSPDIFNNNKEFRRLIKMLTYNIWLFFYGVGMVVREALPQSGSDSKPVNSNKKRICLYVGGNGAKFLTWIMNLRREIRIDGKNCRTAFILKTETSILEAVQHGIEAVTGNTSCTVELELAGNAKCEILDGMILEEYEQTYGMPEKLRGGQCVSEYVADKVNKLTEEIIKSEDDKKLVVPLMQLQGEMNRTDLLEAMWKKSAEVCKQICQLTDCP